MTREKTQTYHSDKVEIIDANHVYYPDIDKTVYYDAAHLAGMNMIARAVRHDRDNVFVGSGDPGCGKSVFMMQCCKFYDPTFSNKDIFFSGEELIKAITSPLTPKYKAFLYDEAREGLNARNSMSKINKILTDCFAEIRQKNLFIGIVLPDFFDLDANIAHRRSRYLYHIYEEPNPSAKEGEDPFRRGFVRFFNKPDKTKLYILGKKFHDMYAIHPSMPPFLFYNQYVVDEEEYRKAKINALRTNRRIEEFEGEKDGVKKYRQKILGRMIREFPGRIQVFWAHVFDVDQKTISNDIREMKAENEFPEEPGNLSLMPK
jgi:hypothetical protein